MTESTAIAFVLAIMVGVIIGTATIQRDTGRRLNALEKQSWAEVMAYQPCIGTLDLTPYNLLPASWKSAMFIPPQTIEWNVKHIITSP